MKRKTANIDSRVEPELDEALLQAFTTLLTAAPGARRAAVLRRGIEQLIADTEPPIRVCAGPIPSRNPDKWSGLRPQLRDIIERRRATRFEVASALGVAPSTLGRLLGAGSDGPSLAVIKRAEELIAAREAETTVSAGDDAEPPEPAKGDPIIRPLSGNGATPCDRPLSAAQREKLAAYLALEGGEVLRQAGVREAAERAVAGDAGLDPKVIEQLAKFLKAAAPEHQTR